MKAYESLWQLAERALEDNTLQIDGLEYLAAGANQFFSLWSRDFAFAARGLIATKRLHVVRNQLDLLLENAREDGLLPRVLDTVSISRRVVAGLLAHRFGGRGPTRASRGALRAQHIDEHGSPALDTNLLVLLTAIDYVDASGETQWWNDHRAQWQRVFDFYDSFRDSDGLLVQPAFSDWQDSAKRSGKTLFLNLLYWAVTDRAQDRGLKVAGGSGDRIRSAVEKELFDKGSGLYRSLVGMPHVSIDGNLLAIDLGFHAPSCEPGSRLYRAMKAHSLWSRGGAPGSVTDRDYPRRWLHFPARIAGLRHYHDRLHWSWLMALAAKVASDVGDDTEADRILTRLQELAVRDGTIVEIYSGTNDLAPFRSWIYRAEAPFSWGAGLALDAVRARARLAAAQNSAPTQVTPTASDSESATPSEPGA